MSHANFQLPGLSAHPNGLASLNVTLAFAYSRRWSRRRLEHHTYAFWDKVLSYLIHDLEPYLFHIPQLMIHNPPAEHPDLSICTDPGANGDEYILENWDRLGIESAKPFMIAELKRTAPRSAKDAETFGENLDSLMQLAREDAEKQAKLAFGVTIYKELDDIILMAACGEWWCFKFATRKSMESQSTGQEDLWNLLASTDKDEEDDDDKVSYKPARRRSCDA
ncbi:hypothetical protein JOM56_007087 [Amanita muscaria]